MFSRRQFLKSLVAACAAMGVSRLPLKAFAQAAPSPENASSITEEMLKRKIPKTGEEIPAIGLGTYIRYNVGHSESELRPRREVLKMFYDNGGRLIDTAYVYGNAEQVLGQLTHELGIKDKLFIATKVWAEGRENGIRQMETSLSRLGVNGVDLMQIHNLTDWQTQIETLKEWKAAGRIRYIGITYSTAGATDRLMEVMKKEPIDFVQQIYSIAVRRIEKDLLPLAQEKGIAILANRNFEGGDLFGKVRAKPLPVWASDIGCTSWAQFFLKYVLSHPAVTCVIPATANPEHMADNLRAGFGRLPDAAERGRMVEYFESL
jgi:aryl-alcohol dehydrogenase-like predicted oxidoreductase